MFDTFAIASDCGQNKASDVDKLYVRYPQGAGGSWLSILIQKLQRRDLNCYDHTDRINFHDIHASSYRGHAARGSDDLVFSGATSFNFFLNFWWKKRVFENYNDFNNLSDFLKLTVLANESRWILYSPEYKETYCERIDIDWTWLWYDEGKFKKKLTHILGIPQTTSVESFIDTQILLYKKSCIDAKFHLGNPFSLPWLSWCYATIIEHEIDLKVNVKDDRDLPLISRFITDQTDKFVDLTLPYTLNIGRNC